MARPAAKVKAPRRIFVLLDASGQGRAALEATAARAAELEAELLAVFVEDVDLLHLAGLPFASEIGFPSATRRGLDADALERKLLRIADEARRSVARIAARRPLQWSFQVARGTLSAQMLAAAAEADLVIEALHGCERAAHQLSGIRRESARAKLLRARTRRELEALRRELQQQE